VNREQRRRLGEQARALLEDPESIVSVFFREAEAAIQADWSRTRPENAHGRELLYWELAALRRVLLRLTALADGARIEDAEQERRSRSVQ
jgi:hypothetical protein